MKEYGRKKPCTLLKCVAFSSIPYILSRVHYLYRTIMHAGSCTHQFRVYSAGFKRILGPRRVMKSSKITIERALNCDKALGGNVADWSFPGQRDIPRSNYYDGALSHQQALRFILNSFNDAEVFTESGSCSHAQQPWNSSCELR